MNLYVGLGVFTVLAWACASEKKWGWFVVSLAIAFCFGLGVYFDFLRQI